MTPTHILDTWKDEIELTCIVSLTLCIALISEEGEIIYANEGMQQLFALNENSNFVNPTIDQLFKLNSANSLIFEGLITIGNESRFNQTINGKIYRKEGQMLVIGEVDVAQLSQQNEIMIDLNNEINDLQRKLIKEKKTLELTLNELTNTNQQLKEANKTKDKFLTIIAHDLKSPFHLIFGYSELLNQIYHTEDHAKIKSIVDVIYNSSKRTYELIENLLFWAQSQRNALELQPEHFNLKEVVLNSISLLQTQASHKNISIETQIPDDLQVFADKNIINTVLRNLVNNAIKFTFPGGSIILKAVSRPSHIEMIISDTGIGILEAVKNKIFQIESTLSTNGTANETGTGLGLRLSKELIEKQGGKIWLESEPGKGSTFHFTIAK